MIKAITFDFWDTIAIDDSDEPKRAALGLPSKAETRLRLFVDEIIRHHPGIAPAQATRAFEHANQRFRHLWKKGQVTPSVADRLRAGYEFLGIAPTPGFAQLVRAIEEMEVHIPPDFAPNVHQALATLAQHYKLGIISDTIHTPGRGIRQLLEKWELLRYFSHFVFSDEVGASKPSAVVFEQAAAGLGVSLSQIIHIGDRESNDVEGPLAVGMPAILYTGIVDRGSEQTRANAICGDYAELPRLITELQEALGK